VAATSPVSVFFILPCIFVSQFDDDNDGNIVDTTILKMTLPLQILDQSISHCVIEPTDIGAEYGDVRPLDAVHMRRLTVNGVQLLDLIDPNDAFISELASPLVGCITWSQRQHLVEMVHSRDRNDKLLEFLTRRSVADYNQFIKVLSKYQAHLVPLLTAAGERFLQYGFSHDL